MSEENKNILYQMLKISKSVLRAEKMLGKTVDYYRDEILNEGVNILNNNKKKELITFGVKNTNQIDRELVELLKENDFLFHTLDKMSKGGRAIDTDLINPLTGNIMTGSSSGSCVNILLGINDFALGTDGGGSVLGPAMSTNLYGIMAKGLGLKGNIKKTSTDNIDFIPGVGVISHNYSLCIQVIETFVPLEIRDKEAIKKMNLKIAVPEKNSIILPTGIDMRRKLESLVEKLGDLVEFIEKDFSNIHNRKDSIDLCREIFNENIDIIMTLEGPVDLLGTGDSILGTWGDTGNTIQQKSGKYLLKIANMVDSTAITIPIKELGMGIVLMSRKGLEGGSTIISLGKIIDHMLELPPLFQKYFIQSYFREEQGYI